MMKPSPPKKPTDSFCCNAMPSDTPRAAHRKASFWQISVPPRRLRSIAMILPGYGEANATRRLTLLSLV